MAETINCDSLMTLEKLKHHKGFVTEEKKIMLTFKKLGILNPIIKKPKSI